MVGEMEESMKVDLFEVLKVISKVKQACLHADDKLTCIDVQKDLISHFKDSKELSIDDLKLFNDNSVSGYYECRDSLHNTSRLVNNLKENKQIGV